MSAAKVAEIITEAGETITLRRLPAIDVTVKASIREYVEADLAGNIIQGTALVHISNKEISDAAWPGPPQPTDRIIRDGKHLNVVSVETRNYKEETALHLLKVRG